MAKPWYNFFVVADVPTDATPAVPPELTARRVSEIVADVQTEVGSVPAEEGHPASIAEIYHAAQIAPPTHGYTVLKVADMLQSEHILTLTAEVKRKSVLVALDAAGVSVNEIVEDAVRRDRALDTYERVIEKSLDERRAEFERHNLQLEEEIVQQAAALRTRIDANNRQMANEHENLRVWQARKHNEERRIAEAIGYFVSENPITLPAVNAKGDTSDAR